MHGREYWNFGYRGINVYGIGIHNATVIMRLCYQNIHGCLYFIDFHLYGFHSCINSLLWRNDEIGLRKNVIRMNIPEYYITIINSREDAFTTFEIKTWLPDFILGINLFRICCDWPIWEEVTCCLGNNKVIHFLLIDRQLNIRTTALPKLGTNTKKAVEDWE